MVVLNKIFLEHEIKNKSLAQKTPQLRISFIGTEPFLCVLQIVFLTNNKLLFVGNKKRNRKLEIGGNKKAGDIAKWMYKDATVFWKEKRRCVIPIYKFECLKCAEVYEDFVSYDKSGKYKTVQCPCCKSKKKRKRFDYDVTATFTNPKESSKWDNFEYRAGFNMENAKSERRAAESASHMGTNPYKNKKLD